jgi:hypothetical protein
MKRYFLPLFSVFCSFGCTGAQPGPGTEESKFKTESAFCAEWAKAACNEDVVTACNGTRSGCLGSQEEVCRVVVPSGYQSKFAEDCLEAVSDAYDDARLSAEELDVVLNLGGACKTLINGGQDEGGNCVRSTDCDGVNGFECVVKPGQSLGTCQIPVEVDGGRRCSTAESVCQSDFYCDGTICAERLLEAESCSGDVCSAGLRCAVATGDVETTCIALSGNGDSCTVNEECESHVCIGATNKVCASNVVLTVESSLCDALR